MPKYRFKTQGSRIEVNVKMLSGETVNERELDFFVRKNLSGLLTAKMVSRLWFSGIAYSGPIGISLKSRLMRPITRYDFFFIVEQIVNILQRMRANSLSADKLVMDLDHVYINETTREIQFIYLPLEKVNKTADILGFIEEIIYSSHIAKDENSDFITEFTYFLKKLSGYNGYEIEKFIRRYEPGIVRTVKEGTENEGKINNKYRPPEGEDDDDEATGLLIEEDDEATGLLTEDDDEATGLLIEEEGTGLLDEDGTEETTLLVEDDDDGTTLLVEDDYSFPTLLRESTQEVISVNKPVFRIGKERSYADYFIANNSAVSRSHADIVTRNGRYYVIDLNSKNKTFVNNRAIPIQQEIELEDGDVLRLANEVFIFRIP